MVRERGEKLTEHERDQVVKELREYLYRVEQSYTSAWSSQLKRAWWPAFILLDDMKAHLPFLIDWLTGGDTTGMLERPQSLIEFELEKGVPVKGPRAFTHDQKRDLYFLAGGRCCICRVRLGPDWHADHVIPWIEGGETTVENGQALCPTCNQRKHAKTWEE